MFNILEAPMGSGKSHFVKEYAKRNPDKTTVLVFFKNGKADFKDTNVKTMYYKELFDQITNNKIDLTNLVIFADEYDYLVSVLDKILYDVEQSINKLPTKTFTEQEWKDVIARNRNFLDYLRSHCQYLFLVSATRVDNPAYYKHGNAFENNLLTDKEISQLNKIRINSVTTVRRYSQISITESLRKFTKDFDLSKYDSIIIYADILDKKWFKDVCNTLTGYNKILIVPEGKITITIAKDLSKHGLVWDSQYQRLTEESFSANLGKVIFLNQSSNRGVSITNFTGNVLIINYGEPTANKLQVGGRFRDTRANVDVVYFVANSSVDENMKALYNIYTANFNSISHNINNKNINDNKYKVIAKYFDSTLSLEKNRQIILSNTGMSVSKNTIKKYALSLNQ